jgi:L-serine dehydratase
MDMFDLIGPVMIGPSSSHTAGAARIGKLARMLLGGEPAEAKIGLWGSFAKTYKGHGTDRALVGGCWAWRWTTFACATASRMPKRRVLRSALKA